MHGKVARQKHIETESRISRTTFRFADNCIIYAFNIWETEKDIYKNGGLNGERVIA